MLLKKIVIAEDDDAIAHMVNMALGDAGFLCLRARDGEEALKLVKAHDPDLFVLDVMMPRVDGHEVAKRLKADVMWSRTPILMLTARDTVENRVEGLDAGADDYLVKPFASVELLARLRSIGRRRTEAMPEAQLTADGLVMDLLRHTVTRDGKSIELTAREFSLLEYFLRHPGQALTRTQILAAVWRYDTDVVSNVVDIYVHYLRDKVDQGFAKRLLHTIRGVGYALRD